MYFCSKLRIPASSAYAYKPHYYYVWLIYPCNQLSDVLQLLSYWTILKQKQKRVGMIQPGATRYVIVSV